MDETLGGKVEEIKATGMALLGSSQKTVSLCERIVEGDNKQKGEEISGSALQEMIELYERWNKSRRQELYNSMEYHVGFQEGVEATTRELQPKIEKLQDQVIKLQAQLSQPPVRDNAPLLGQEKRLQRTKTP